ncbi:MAG: ATP synthase F0 subunit C [Bdellovibrionales bacterium]|nr:ATP synthase F0 subunit C [Bdellovibrionales bacterium]
MKNYLYFLGICALAMVVAPEAAFAQDGGVAGYLPIGIGLTLGLAALGGTLGQAKAASAGLDAIGRNPSAKGEIQTPMLIGLAFIESLVVLAFVIAFFMNGKL